MPSSTPHPTQRWKVRWMVLSSPNSPGQWFHWQLLRVRKIMPPIIFRWSALLRPLALGGSNSSITGVNHFLYFDGSAEGSKFL